MFCFSQITITQSITYLAKKSIEVETQAFSFWYKNYCFSMPLCVGKDMKFRYLRVRKYIINHVGDEMKQGSLKFSNSDTPTADPQLVTEAQQKVTITAASSHLFMFAHCSRLPNFTLWKFGKEYSCHHGIITKLTFNLNKKKITHADVCCKLSGSGAFVEFDQGGGSVAGFGCWKGFSLVAFLENICLLFS